MLGCASIGPALRRSPVGHLGSVAIGLVLVVALAACTSSGKKPRAGPSPTGNAPRVTSLTAMPKSGGEVDLYWSGTGKDLYGYYLIDAHLVA